MSRVAGRPGPSWHGCRWASPSVGSRRAPPSVGPRAGDARRVLLLSVVAALGCGAGPSRELTLTPQSSGTGSLLQAVSAVDERVVWVSGHDGVYVRTEDGGVTWQAATVPEAGVLQFRDVEAFDERSAYLMSAGTGELSRIYRTDDAGASWTLQYVADHPSAFLDCMGFWSPDRGLVYGDAVDGVPFVLRTEDGGSTWARVPAGALPAALEGEGGFAASGTCLTTGEGGRAWIATGNGARARVLMTEDWGEAWTAVDAPVAGGEGAGLTTVHVLSDGSGIALGGVIGADTLHTSNVALTLDGGTSWRPGGRLVLAGPVYGSELLAGGMAVAVGPGGLDWSDDGGRSWRRGDARTFWAVDFAAPGSGWAVGPEGRIVRVGLERRR